MNKAAASKHTEPMMAANTFVMRSISPAFVGQTRQQITLNVSRLLIRFTSQVNKRTLRDQEYNRQRQPTKQPSMQNCTPAAVELPTRQRSSQVGPLAERNQMFGCPPPFPPGNKFLTLDFLDVDSPESPLRADLQGFVTENARRTAVRKKSRSGCISLTEIRSGSGLLTTCLLLRTNF